MSLKVVSSRVPTLEMSVEVKAWIQALFCNTKKTLVDRKHVERVKNILAFNGFNYKDWQKKLKSSSHAF